MIPPEPFAGKLFKVLAALVSVIVLTMIAITSVRDYNSSVRADERKKVLEELQARSLVPQCPKFGFGKTLKVGRAESSPADGMLSCYYE